MAIQNYQELIVWNKAMDLVTEVYALCKLLPKEELFALSNQMRRAVVSVPSNIAEGQQRMSAREFIRFLGIARGSNGELQTQLLICTRLSYLSKEQIHCALTLSYEIAKMITALIRSLEKTEVRNSKLL